MSTEEIFDAQSPMAGWQTETRAFAHDATAYSGPKWSDFEDPLDAISKRAAEIKARARAGANEEAQGGQSAGLHRYSPEEREALKIMGLGPDIDRKALRERYSKLVRLYHPDRNSGDRSFEGKLQKAVEAYQLLRGMVGLD